MTLAGFICGSFTRAPRFVPAFCSSGFKIPSLWLLSRVETSYYAALFWWLSSVHPATSSYLSKAMTA